MRVLTPILALILSASMATAGPVNFNAWRTHWFAIFSKVKFVPSGDAMAVTADGAVSITYDRLGEQEWGARKASWRWSVDSSVPATDLRRKGGDDRNLALYFAFLPNAEAERLKGTNSLRKLLNHPEGRVLAYVWGGNHQRGAVLGSPYLGNRGKTIVLRGSGTGRYSESVDLAADYRRAFGSEPDALVALALSADSDDTDAIMRGQVSNFKLQ
ncbi:Protein of unknown function [Aliiroseovarius halocynthiae]|uniref:DUF3047 domain-containing protein n=1 Tax=Aliiroseovarius halocynthiae TaxID=985055 RepID=A0A545SXX6_9RHOB|nr:DUF3047 domain-containing protein [Aliiroseovarius halocynthiae]TQV69818.1 DUF3047 domain-containing protein [Aliiroseovarius halocynthiae]SMR81698.1 Protein of unknown function [Aliiroseovarius halocynthiae]